MTRHKHADLIIAWAEGAEIEVEIERGRWEKRIPYWNESSKYRLKPKEPEWYENIPKQGVLCWVSEHNVKPSNVNVISVITIYNPEANRDYSDARGVTWRYATPLTNEEIERFKR